MLYRILVLIIGILLSSLTWGSVIDLNPYFQNLNYFNTSERGTQLKYEAQFKKFLTAVLNKNEVELTSEDAKTILYGTLFLTNINQGYRFNQISYQELIQSGQLAPNGTNAQHELIAREELILANLHLAKRLLPNDYRIDSWIGTHELYQEELTTGKISDENFNKMFALAQENVFSYTAMAVISNELTLSREQQSKMLGLAQLVSENKIPCVKNENGRCFEKKLAPQTNNVGKIITGDIYLRDASRYVEGKVDLEGKRINSGVSARVIYGIVTQKKFPNLKSLDWTNIYIRGRVKAINELLWKEKPVDAHLLDSTKFKRAYTCYACHAQ